MLYLFIALILGYYHQADCRAAGLGCIFAIATSLAVGLLLGLLAGISEPDPLAYAKDIPPYPIVLGTAIRNRELPSLETGLVNLASETAGIAVGLITQIKLFRRRIPAPEQPA